MTTPSWKLLNGSQIATGPSNARAIASTGAFPTLPSFNSSRSTSAVDRPRLSVDARRTAQEHSELGQRLRLDRVRLAAKAEARRRALSNLLITAFALSTCVMAAYTMHREQQLTNHEQQLLQGLR